MLADSSTLECEPQPGSVSDEPRALAFMDGKPSSESAGGRTDEIGRRLGRIRLLPEPVLEHKPLSDLGFDPILSHPTFDEFKDLIGKKKGTIKGVIMDQAFSAGVGNVSISTSACCCYC
jgi:formamidopyrimidine-DNA glycosylase